MNWSDYPNFKESEFACSHTGKCEMTVEAMELFQRIRTRLGRPLTVNSGYRDRSHPDERKKLKPGSHAQGKAVDFHAPTAKERFEIMEAALAEMKPGIQPGIGIAKTFIHIDIGHDHAFRPAVWSY